MTNKQQGPAQPTAGKMFNVMLTDIAIAVLKFMAKALIVMFFYNLIVPSMFTGANPLNYGQAFVFTALVTLLFGHFDSFEKSQTISLHAINLNMANLVNNQIQQNNLIVSMLYQIIQRLDKSTQTNTDSEQVGTIVDETSDTDYNTEQSPEI